MNKKKFLINSMIVLVVFFLLSGIVYFAAGEQFFIRKSKGEIESVVGDFATYEVTKDFAVTQEFVCTMDRLDTFTIQLATFARQNTGYVKIQLINKTEEKVLYDKEIDVSTLIDSVVTQFNLKIPAKNVFGDIMQIIISSPKGQNGNAVAPWFNSKGYVNNQQLYYNGEPVDGVLCFSTFGMDNVWTGLNYWKIVCWGACFLLLYICYTYQKVKNDKNTRMMLFCKTVFKYKFLIKQLVNRDFKIKYRRSMLGALWSFINPLFTMIIQYIVFSTIFKSDIKNYPVYLLSGIVLYSFFTEATGVALMSIVGNASLIKKVYVPKYLYPVTKIFSSAVNLLIAMIPLTIMCLYTKVTFTKAFLLIPFPLICLIVFSIGIGLILASVMTLFRDVQFIWSVISLVWMYATPIFYPENILPENFSFVLKINPIYYIIKFFRTIVIEGISPEPIMYLQCGLFAGITLLLGGFIFKKLQDKFVFYL